MRAVLSLAAILAITACAAPRADLPGPDVYVSVGHRADRDWTYDEIDIIQTGADQWRRACFNVRLVGESPDDAVGAYGEEWFSFRVVRDGSLPPDLWGEARGWKGEIAISPEPQGDSLQAVVSHEFGHMLANSVTHLPDPDGVMFRVASWGGATLTEADLAWICDLGGWCDRCAQ